MINSVGLQNPGLKAVCENELPELGKLFSKPVIANISGFSVDEYVECAVAMKEAVTITVGNVIGVGLFTTGAQIVGTLGSTVIIATLIAAIISIYPAKLYAEMGAALPFAGGTYKYAQLGLGKSAGVLAGWNFIASLIAVTSGEALAFSFYFKTMDTLPL